MNVPSNPKVGLSIAKKIEEILRYLKQERITGVIGGRLVQTPNGKSIVIDKAKVKNSQSSSDCPLSPSIRQDGTSYLISISSGFSGNLIPTFAGSPVGTLNAQPITAATKLWLRVEWAPAKQWDIDFGFYWMIAGGYHVSSSFVFSSSQPSGTTGSIDSSSGAETNHVQHFLWADIVSAFGVLSIGTSRCGNHSPVFCPGNIELNMG